MSGRSPDPSNTQIEFQATLTQLKESLAKVLISAVKDAISGTVKLAKHLVVSYSNGLGGYACNSSVTPQDSNQNVEALQDLHHNLVKLSDVINTHLINCNETELDQDLRTRIETLAM
jgi:hypothetical protein